MTEHTHGINAEQYDVLMQPLRPHRVAKRTVSGRELSYLEAWDVKAHLTRIFGFGNFDSETIHEQFLGAREYESDKGKDMVEVIWHARHRLVVRDQHGGEIARYCEGAVGSASGPVTQTGDLHDNALKSAASDALKRCATNLGTQFGLSLYANGSKNDVVKTTLVRPEGAKDATSPGGAADAGEERQGAAAQVNARISALNEAQRRALSVKWGEVGFPNVAQITPEQAAVANGWLDEIETEAGKQAATERLGATEVPNGNEVKA